MRYAILFFALILFVLIYVRFSPMDPRRWHIDPLSMDYEASGNSVLWRDAGGDAPALHLEADPAQVAETLDRIIRAKPRVVALAGSVATGHMTYVQRSRIMGYPDAITVRVLPDGAGASVVIYSRSRFGRSDLGVNAARVRSWMSELGDALAS
jgi:uncharacterized protein (DUF1499 family)